ncbi:MAG: hypothetical protein OEY63_06775 [Gemmatimonadota bacterium]|nr:hypothetical protein [Gemmatimonadota bacterium]
MIRVTALFCCLALAFLAVSCGRETPVRKPPAKSGEKNSGKDDTRKSGSGGESKAKVDTTPIKDSSQGESESARLADRAIDIDFAVKGLTAKVVVEGLKNPHGLAFHPKTDALTVCDSGNGRVLIVDDGKLVEFATGFGTETSGGKGDMAAGENEYLIGPLSICWENFGRVPRLAVLDSGAPAGGEAVVFFEGPGPRYGTGDPTMPWRDPSGSGLDMDGNFTGLCLSVAHVYYFLSTTNDAQTRLMCLDTRDQQIRPWISSDEAGIKTNTPVQLRLVNHELRGLYMGEEGKSDGLMVFWMETNPDPEESWKLKGLVDPVGFDQFPELDRELAPGRGDIEPADGEVPGDAAAPEMERFVRRFVVVARGKSRGKGILARVTLNKGTEANIEPLAEGLPDPTHCAFGPDGKLYISCMGSERDKDKGIVIAVEGIK